MGKFIDAKLKEIRMKNIIFAVFIGLFFTACSSGSSSLEPSHRSAGCACSKKKSCSESSSECSSSVSGSCSAKASTCSNGG